MTGILEGRMECWKNGQTGRLEEGNDGITGEKGWKE
jgi:hypothetical protein